MPCTTGERRPPPRRRGKSASRQHSIEIGPIDKKRNLEKIEALIKVMDLTSVRVLLKD